MIQRHFVMKLLLLLINYLDNKCSTGTQHDLGFINFMVLKIFKTTQKQTIDRRIGKGDYFRYTSPSLKVSIADKNRTFVF